MDKTFSDVRNCNEHITNDKQKRALLLYQAGEATQEIFETLPETGDDCATAQAKLDEYFSPKKNVDYQVFQFRQAVQQPGETVDQFVTRLRKLAATCEFGDVAKEIKSAVRDSELPLQTITKIRVTRRCTYP